ncbi:MAG: ABC transporter permease subunit [Clostridia bacterium]|nr:ABC transporter permease subunit [Clostridia bacterium]
MLISFGSLIINMPIAIIFALSFNELHNKALKRVIQSSTFFPSLLSTVVIIGIAIEVLSPSTGVFNQLLMGLGIIKEPIYFVNDPKYYRVIYILTATWKSTGANAIIYIAALSNVDLSLYESAMIDGANRWKQTWHITLPSIKNVTSVILILNLGRVLTLGTEKTLLLMTPNNSGVSEIISTYVYNIGILGNNYSYAAAIGLFNAVVGLILVLTTRTISRKIDQDAIL